MAKISAEDINKLRGGDSRHLDLMERNQELRAALKESVKLQSHYAALLNGWDGGARMTFENENAWLERLKKLRESD